MKTARATDIKNRFGLYLDSSLVEPVVIEKNGRPVAVMMSMSDYERLTTLEDAHWAEKAKKAEKAGYLGTKKSLAFLKSK